jgi:hypothetical protein
MPVRQEKKNELDLIRLAEVWRATENVSASVAARD